MEFTARGTLLQIIRAWNFGVTTTGFKNATEILDLAELQILQLPDELRLL